MLQIANIRVRLNELKESLDESIRNQDFSHAAEIKQSISELEAERNQLLDLPQTQTEEIRTEKVKLITVRLKNMLLCSMAICHQIIFKLADLGTFCLLE
jgi:hypothetical protein